MNNNEKIIKDSNKVACSILEKYIELIKDDMFSISSLLPDMIDELQEKVLFSGINPKEMMVKREVRRLIKYDSRFSDYKINEDKMIWITREYHDNYFDFESFQVGVIEAMKEVENNYDSEI